MINLLSLAVLAAYKKAQEIGCADTKKATTSPWHKKFEKYGIEGSTMKSIWRKWRKNVYCFNHLG
jgi:hypothetical protein